ncbi:MAG: hypothetical protein AAFZ07_19515 [Actinomycetota bacterium]
MTVEEARTRALLANIRDDEIVDGTVIAVEGRRGSVRLGSGLDIDAQILTAFDLRVGDQVAVRSDPDGRQWIVGHITKPEELDDEIDEPTSAVTVEVLNQFWKETLPAGSFVAVPFDQPGVVIEDTAQLWQAGLFERFAARFTGTYRFQASVFVLNADATNVRAEVVRQTPDPNNTAVPLASQTLGGQNLIAGGPFTNQGTWAAGINYEVNDVVQSSSDSNWYVCTTAGLSAGDDSFLTGGSDTGASWALWDGNTITFEAVGQLTAVYTDGEWDPFRSDYPILRIFHDHSSDIDVLYSFSFQLDRVPDSVDTEVRSALSSFVADSFASSLVSAFFGSVPRNGEILVAAVIWAGNGQANALLPDGWVEIDRGSLGPTDIAGQEDLHFLVIRKLAINETSSSMTVTLQNTSTVRGAAGWVVSGADWDATGDGHFIDTGLYASSDGSFPFSPAPQATLVEVGIGLLGGITTRYRVWCFGVFCLVRTGQTFTAGGENFDIGGGEVIDTQAAGRTGSFVGTKVDQVPSATNSNRPGFIAGWDTPADQIIALSIGLERADLEQP